MVWSVTTISYQYIWYIVQIGERGGKNHILCSASYCSAPSCWKTATGFDFWKHPHLNSKIIVYKDLAISTFISMISSISSSWSAERNCFITKHLLPELFRSLNKSFVVDDLDDADGADYGSDGDGRLQLFKYCWLSNWLLANLWRS